MYVYKLHAFCDDDDDAEGEDFCSYEEDPKNFGVSVRNVKKLVCEVYYHRITY